MWIRDTLIGIATVITVWITDCDDMMIMMMIMMMNVIIVKMMNDDDENQDILGFIFCSVAPKRLDKQ